MTTLSKLNQVAAEIVDSYFKNDSNLVDLAFKDLKKQLEKPATIVRSPNGQGRREVELAKVQIPDCWHAAEMLKEPHKSMVLETWHLCHDLLLNLRGDI